MFGGGKATTVGGVQEASLAAWEGFRCVGINVACYSVIVIVFVIANAIAIVIVILGRASGVCMVHPFKYEEAF